MKLENIENLHRKRWYLQNKTVHKKIKRFDNIFLKR